MSSFIIKLIAIIAMFFDHAGYAIYGKLSWCNYIGRLAFPLFAFQISEGYSHTSNLKKYFLRLGIFAIISQIPLMMLYSIFAPTVFMLNIFFTLILGLAALTIYDKSSNKIIGLLGVALCATLAHFLKTDYGEFGVLLIFAFYTFKNNKPLMFISISALSVYLYWESFKLLGIQYKIVLLVIYTILPVFITYLYNGKKGKNLKHLFYWFYPVHLILLYFINVFIFNPNPNHMEVINNTISYITTNLSKFI